MGNDEQCRSPSMHARNMGVLKPNNTGYGSCSSVAMTSVRKGFDQDGRRSAGAQQHVLANHCIYDCWSFSTVASKGITQYLPLPRALPLPM